MKEKKDGIVHWHQKETPSSSSIREVLATQDVKRTSLPTVVVPVWDEDCATHVAAYSHFDESDDDEPTEPSDDRCWCSPRHHDWDYAYESDQEGIVMMHSFHGNMRQTDDEYDVSDMKNN